VKGKEPAAGKKGRKKEEDESGVLPGPDSTQPRLIPTEGKQNAASSIEAVPRSGISEVEASAALSTPCIALELIL
jgi:hypothetical protein